MSEYAALLRSPMWQKKRLEILKSREFKSQEAHEEDEESQLHVHHCWYEKNKKPWEYEDSCYRVLTEKQHKFRQSVEFFIKKEISRFDSVDLYDLLRLLEALGGDADEDCLKLCLHDFLIESKRMVKRKFDLQVKE